MAEKVSDNGREVSFGSCIKMLSEKEFSAVLCFE